MFIFMLLELFLVYAYKDYFDRWPGRRRKNFLEDVHGSELDSPGSQGVVGGVELGRPGTVELPGSADRPRAVE
jgi:hypothetical protein